MVTLAEVRAIAGNIAGRVVDRKLRRVWSRLRSVVRHGTLQSIDPTTGFQTLNVGTLAGDEDRGISYVQDFGFRSVPPAGSEGIVLRIGGDRANSVGICFGNRSLTLSTVDTGETAIYALSGAQIILRDSGNIEVIPGPGGRIELGGPTAALGVARETDPTMMSPEMMVWLAAVHAWIVAAHAIPVIGAVLAALPIPILPPVDPPSGEGFVERGSDTTVTL